jgi:hypothetical protein
VKLGALLCILLCVAACQNGGAETGAAKDGIAQASEKLTKASDEQVNATIAKIESESRDAIKEQAPPPPENATSLSSGNQN